MQLIDRNDLLKILQEALEPEESVLAMFEGGSAAFGRADEWSDLDLQFVTRDDAVEQTAAKVEEVLAGITEIDLRYEISQPAWHGHYQVFYRFKNASPFLLLDLVIMKVSNPLKFLEPEIHGNRLVYFDKDQYTIVPPLDEGEFRQSMERAVLNQKLRFELGRLFTTKELNRGNPLVALGFYYQLTLAPLVYLLRSRYSPYHYNFGLHSIQYDLPGDVLRRLQELYFVGDGEDLQRKHAEATRWFDELVGEIQ